MSVGAERCVLGLGGASDFFTIRKQWAAMANRDVTETLGHFG